VKSHTTPQDAPHFRIIALLPHFDNPKTQHMKTTSKTKDGKFYKDLLTHCNKQYKNIGEIRKAYTIGGSVFGIDYISTSGLECLATNTATAESVIDFN
jgi:hypothetical protein